MNRPISRRVHQSLPTVLMPLRKRQPNIWSGPLIIRSVSTLLSRGAEITTARASFRRNSCRLRYHTRSMISRFLFTVMGAMSAIGSTLKIIARQYACAGKAVWSNLQLGSRNAGKYRCLQSLLDAVGKPHSLIRYVKDRPGHDRRYAIDPSLIESELGWHPSETWESGLQKTIQWYQQNGLWLERARSGTYQDYYRTQYGTEVGAA